MSLFKILKGAQDGLKTNAANIHAGWAYFTEDKGNFYIDTEENRVQINPKSKSYELTIAADKWSENKAVTGYYLAETIVPESLDLYNGTLGFPENLNARTMADMTYCQLKICDVLPNTAPGETTLRIGANRKPTKPITLILTIVPKEGAIIKGPTGV